MIQWMLCPTIKGMSPFNGLICRVSKIWSYSYENVLQSIKKVENVKVVDRTKGEETYGITKYITIVARKIYTVGTEG
jgi:hypothetical protein